MEFEAMIDALGAGRGRDGPRAVGARNRFVFAVCLESHGVSFGQPFHFTQVSLVVRLTDQFRGQFGRQNVDEGESTFVRQLPHVRMWKDH